MAAWVDTSCRNQVCLRTVPTIVIVHTVQSAHLKTLGFPMGDAYKYRLGYFCVI